tara:strand:- start:50 stop:175 length:126 start_codon:yes stop_codon:yes gene_type:complete
MAYFRIFIIGLQLSNIGITQLPEEWYFLSFVFLNTIYTPVL